MKIKKNSLNLQKYKKYEFAKIFLYGFDELIYIDVEKYLNLLFEVIHKNLDDIISNDIYILIYIYYGYFKTHICCLLFNFMNFNLEFLMINYYLMNIKFLKRKMGLMISSQIYNYFLIILLLKM